jgi:hypothetical protein
MKIAFLSESPADEAALRILIESLLGASIDRIDLPSFQGRTSWPGIVTILPAVLTELHYQTDAQALVVSADSDNSPVHHVDHALPEKAEPKCRLCMIREAVTRTRNRLRPRYDGSVVKVGIGLAVPVVEA